MKIIQIITELYPAGAEKILLNLSTDLKKRGNDVKVISLQPLPKKQTDIIDDLKANKIEIKALNITKKSPWRILRLISFIKHEIKNQESKIILHSHLIHANLALRFACIFIDKKKIKIINTIHTTEKRTSKWWHFILDKFTFKLCNTQTTISKATQQFYARKTRVNPDRITIVYNGISPPNLLNNEQIEKLRDEWKFNDCSKIIGSIGRLSWEKGFDILLESILRLSAIVPINEKWGVVILGEGHKRLQLEEIITKHICSNIKVILPGYRKDAPDCIGAFDLFIMPSRYEGFGLALIEAMSHGVPILCNELDSLVEILGNYSSYATFSIDNRIEFLEKFKLVLEMKKCKPELNFTIENMVDKYITVYNLPKLDS